MAKIQPVKRSKQLVKLSRDHHDALLFTWKIKQGLKNEVSLNRIINYIDWFWTNHLKDHFDEEEKILLPYLAGDDELADQLKAEHASIRNLISEKNEESIRSLVDILNDHIRFEERKFFPHLEKLLSDQQLDKIAIQLQDQPHCKNDWLDEFWKK